MIEFFILMMWWADDGSLQASVNRGFETRETCERRLVLDQSELRKTLPSALGLCVATPPKPKRLPDEPSKSHAQNI